MANNVGNISIGLGLDNQPLEAALNASVTRLKQFGGDVSQAGTNASSASGGFEKLQSTMSGVGLAMESASQNTSRFFAGIGGDGASTGASGIGQVANAIDRFDTTATTAAGTASMLSGQIGQRGIAGSSASAVAALNRISTSVLGLNGQMRGATASANSMAVAVNSRGVAMAGASAAASAGGFRQFAATMSSIAMPMQQVSFGIQDFASQFGTRGLGAGLASASNNVQMLGASFGPMGLAISAALGLAVGGIGTYLDMQSRMQKQAKETADVLGQAWKRVGQDAQRGAEEYRMAFRSARDENSDIERGVGSPSASQLQQQIREDERQLLELQRKRNSLANEFNKALPKQISMQGGRQGIAFGAGVQLPSGQTVAIADANSKTGPLFQRAFGEQTKGLEKEFGLTPENIAAIGRIEQELIRTNDQIDATIARGEARSRQLPNAIKRDAEDERMQESQRQRLKDIEAAAEKTRQLKQDGEAFRRSIESPEQALKRRQQEITNLRDSGAITAPEADIGLNKLAEEFSKQQKTARTQPDSLQTFERNSQETLSAMNRIFRNARDVKTVEKNTADTVKAVETQTATLDRGFNKMAKITVVRFS